MLTQPEVLKDSDPAERRMGIEAGLAWGEVADATVVYVDRGMSPGMKQGIDRALAEGRPVEYRAFRTSSPLHRLMNEEQPTT